MRMDHHQLVSEWNHRQPLDRHLNKASESIRHMGYLTETWGKTFQQLANEPLEQPAPDLLHALRDQLIPNEAADLAAQLPMLLRGLYFEGYRPAVTPDHVRNREQFLQRVARDLVPGADPPADQACSAVFAAIQRHVTAGEVKDVCNMLPKHIRSLWPAQQQTGQA